MTGIYNTGRQVASIDALLTTFYGQSLLSKIGLMLLMGSVGLMNAMLLHDRVAAPLAKLLRRPAGWTPLSLQRLPQLVLAEMSLGLLVILFVGLVTSAPNPNGPEFAPFDEDAVLGMVSTTVEDLLISFSAKPNRPGQNVFLIRAASSRRPAPAEVLRVIARLTYLDEEIGTITVDAQEIDEGQYHIGGSYFSLAGKWHVEVAVRRQGVEDTVAQFDWVVQPAGDRVDQAIFIARRIDVFVNVGLNMTRFSPIVQALQNILVFPLNRQGHPGGAGQVPQDLQTTDEGGTLLQHGLPIFVQ